MSEHEVSDAQIPISMPQYQNPFNLGQRLSINMDKLNDVHKSFKPNQKQYDYNDMVSPSKSSVD